MSLGLRDSELRRSLQTLLDGYFRRYPEESEIVGRFQDFAASGEILQGKSNTKRHVTASAWIVNKTRDRFLLTHHAKLGIWVQLGGHTDEGEGWSSAALREVCEESGLQELRLVGSGLFDLDVHEIPAWGETPLHEHYDLRFLVEADDLAPLKVTAESRSLAWVHRDDLSSYTEEESQIRMAKKVRSLPV